MSSAIHRGQSLQSLSLDELGVIQVQSESIDDSTTVRTVDSKVSDLAIDSNKAPRPVSSSKGQLDSVPENSETVEDVRNWAKEASFKLKSFNFKMPGDKGSPFKSKIPTHAPPVASSSQPSKAISKGIAASASATSFNEPAISPQKPVAETTSSTTSATASSSTSQSTERIEKKSPEKAPLEEEKEEKEDLPPAPEPEPEPEPEPVIEAQPPAAAVIVGDDDSTINTLITKGRGKSKSASGDQGDDEEGGDDEDELKGIALRPTEQNVFVKQESAPVFTNVNLRPVPKVVESKKFNMTGSSASVSALVNLKATHFGSRDSLSTLSRSHDDDHLSVQSEPLPPKRPTERVITPYETLKKINRMKVYGDYIPEELEYYLSDVEFQKVLGKSRAEFYNMPLWKQQFLKKRAQLF